MAVNLTIHIGAGKTGTSAIQTFLRTNAAELATEGVLVPPSTLDNTSKVTGYHVWHFDELRRLNPAEARGRLTSSLVRLVGEAATPVRQVILSAENLSYPVHWAAIFDNLSETFDLRILFYVRRQDDYLLSAWQQWNSKESSDFWAWVVRHVGVQANWRLTVQEWEKVVPQQHIDIRVYDRRQLTDGDVISDFRNVIQSTAPLKPADERINPSFNAGVLDLIAGNRALFDSIHDNGFFKLLETMTGSAHLSVRGESTITFEQRLAILERYEKSNAWIHEKYFKSHGTKTLFDAPRRADYHELSREEIDKQKWNVVADLLYKLHNKAPAKPSRPNAPFREPPVSQKEP